MRILAIESSCDETAAAILEAPYCLKSSIVASQIDAHRPYGGVVPELASRHHVAAIVPVVREAMEQAGLDWSQLDAIAATRGPGLIGSLMVGLQFAKGLAAARGLTFIGVHHLEGHLAAAFLDKTQPDYPFVALLVSGGHTGLYLVSGVGQVNCLGATRDDAAGEAFDKVATLLGLGYPGGIAIESESRGGDPCRFKLPRAMRARRNLDFSFSGLKTAARQTLAGLGPHIDSGTRRDFCASLQAAIVDSLVEKSSWALQKTGASQLVVAGGVAANQALRQRLQQLTRETGVQTFVPPLIYCTDNAAMIAVAAAMRLAKGESHDLTVAPQASLSLAATTARF